MNYVILVVVFVMIFWGAKVNSRGSWNEECLSLRQMKALQGAMAVCILLHHMAQKTCAPWQPPKVIVHGLDLFVNIGYLFVSIFLFCSGYGLLKSVHAKPDYLKDFLRRRILPIVLAFYASEWIYLIVRAALGEKMDAAQVFYYITGAQLANYYAWYAIALPIFYLIFYLAFRFCKTERMAIFATGVGIFIYICIGLVTDHNDWWMRGEWWYNTAYLFVLGMIVAKNEKKLLEFFKRYYIPCLVMAAVLVFATYFFSQWALGNWSYYGELFFASDKLLRRVGCLLSQIAASFMFVWFVFLVMMKVRISNRVLDFFGSVTLEFYLIHGLFVELFGHNFLDTTDSLFYMKSLPLYMLAVLACSIVATLLFKRLLRLLNHAVIRQQITLQKENN